MKILLSNKIPNFIKEYLSSYGSVFLLEPDLNMPTPIQTHPDSLIFNDNDTYIIPKNYEFGKNLLESFGLNVILTNENEGEKYPDDTIVNAFVCNSILYAGKSVSSAIVEYANNQQYTIAYVKQGYTHCSSFIFSNSVITQDKGIYKSAIEHNTSCLKVYEANIDLPGYACGFIGGSCITIGNDVIFYGDVSKHPSYHQILDYINQKGGNIKYFEEFPLTDFGGGIVIGD